MQSIDEMVANDFAFYMHQRFFDLTIDHREIFKRKRQASDDKQLPFSEEVDDTLRAAFLTTIDDVIYRNQKTHKRFILQICNERFSLINVVMYYPKNFFLKEAIDQRISELLSSGILHHWIERYIDDSYIDVKTGTERKQLSLNHLFGVFNILLIGYAIACICLIIEITMSKARAYGRARKSIRRRKRADK
jgi:tagatose-1,6-bisphosphate aldolase non-catalytic subunit AgaZ/GatZ